MAVAELENEGAEGTTELRRDPQRGLQASVRTQFFCVRIWNQLNVYEQWSDLL